MKLDCAMRSLNERGPVQCLDFLHSADLYTSGTDTAVNCVYYRFPLSKKPFFSYSINEVLSNIGVCVCVCLFYSRMSGADEPNASEGDNGLLNAAVGSVEPTWSLA